MKKLRYFPATTREPSANIGRLTDLVSTGSLFDRLEVPVWSAETDRIMICGSLEMCKDVAALAEGFGMAEGSNSSPGDFVIEKAFVS